MTRFAFVLPILAILCATGAQADTIYDNLLSPVVTGNSPDPIAQDSVGPLANSFFVSTAFDFGDLQLRLSAPFGTEGRGGTITVTLLGDSSSPSGNPGDPVPVPGSAMGVLGTIDASTLTTTSQVITLVLATPVPLDANTRYWIQLSADARSGGGWDFESDASGLGVMNEFHSNSGGDGVSNNDGGAYEMAISTAPSSSVPEPITLSLFGAGLAGAAIARRRRKSA